MSDVAPMRKLRIEEPQDRPKPVVTRRAPDAPAVLISSSVATTDDLNNWKALAIQTKERLAFMENQNKDLREAADELRQRLTKSKGRQESAQQKINELQIRLVELSAERDSLREKVADQEIVKRKVHEFRQQILEGPLWELFREL